MNIRATICIRTSYNPTLRKVQYYCSRLLNVNRRFVTKTLKKKKPSNVRRGWSLRETDILYNGSIRVRPLAACFGKHL